MGLMGNWGVMGAATRMGPLGSRGRFLDELVSAAFTAKVIGLSVHLGFHCAAGGDFHPANWVNFHNYSGNIDTGTGNVQHCRP